MSLAMPLMRQQSGLTLRPYQREAVDKLRDFLFNQSGNPLVVLPTGCGKSLVLAEFCRGMLEEYPNVRIFIMTHAQELVGQNYEELMGIWPQAPAGIHNAGLRQWDVKSPIIYGSIQSMHKKAFKFQNCDIVLVDEAHSIPKKSGTTWNKFFADMKVINPYLRVAGLTATPFRMDSGMLHRGDGAMFNEIVYEYSITEAIEEGYLTPPVSRFSATQIDTGSVRVHGGEFVPTDLEAVAADPVTVDAIVKEIIKEGQNRLGWIVFGTGVKHCMMMREAINDYGYSCEGVFAKEPESYAGRKYDRKAFVNDYRARKIRCLVSMNALTTGFNAKHVDLVALARPTKSVGLYIQAVGRGTRPLYAPGFDLNTREGRLLAIANGEKPNCLVLDFGGNIQRHGLIDKPNVKEPNKGDGAMPTKACPACGQENFIAARVCKACGEPFPVEGAKVSVRAAAAPVLSTQLTQPKWAEVHGVTYSIHQKNGKTPTLKVTYQCGMLYHNEWICFSHEGYARRRAVDWWHSRAITSKDKAAPTSVEEALDRADELRKPKEIRIRAAGQDLKYTEIIGASF